MMVVFFFHTERKLRCFPCCNPFPAAGRTHCQPPVPPESGHESSPRPVPSRPVPSPRSPRSRSPLGVPQPCAAHEGHLAAPVLSCPPSVLTSSPKPRSVEGGKRGSKHSSPSGSICSYYGGLFGCCAVCKSASSSENRLCATELGFHLFWVIRGVLGLTHRRALLGLMDTVWEKEGLMGTSQPGGPSPS